MFPNARSPRQPVVHSLTVCAALILATVAVGVCQAQSGKLADKLESLNIRHRTEHYVLSGTVRQERLEEYGRALEYIHREYRRGFASLMDQEGDSGDNTGRRDKAKSKHGKRQVTEDQTPGQPTGGKPKRKSDANGADSAGDAKPKNGGKPENKPGKDRSNREDDESILSDDDDRFRVIVFARPEEYQRFGQAYIAGGSEHTNGMFIESLRLVLVLEQSNQAETFSTLFHEAFHQFMRRHVENPPVWLNEGLAVHYGYAQPTGRGLSFKNPPDQRWRLARTLVSQKQALPLWKVISADRGAFYDDTPVEVRGYERVRMSSLHYSQAYTFVHMLLSEESGRQRLKDYIHALAEEGANPHEVTRRFFDEQTCNRLESHWVKHLSSRPETR